MMTMWLLVMSMAFQHPPPITEIEIIETHQDIARRLAQDKYRLVCGIIEVESNWNEKAISKTGDYGLMQINKRTWQKHFDWDRILEPEYNIMVGLYILELCLEKSRGDIFKALIYYNGSCKYPPKVLKKMENYQ
jgi:soluble lytic murein transglycosylase-like protein